MSGLKRFLDRRSEGLEKKKMKSHAKAPEIQENQTDKVPENPDLTDEEFWEISNRFLKERKRSDKDPVIILQEILSHYTPHKIKQFAKRYEELNS